MSEQMKVQSANALMHELMAAGPIPWEKIPNGAFPPGLSDDEIAELRAELARPVEATMSHVPDSQPDKVKEFFASRLLVRIIRVAHYSSFPKQYQVIEAWGNGLRCEVPGGHSEGKWCALAPTFLESFIESCSQVVVDMQEMNADLKLLAGAQFAFQGMKFEIQRPPDFQVTVWRPRVPKTRGARPDDAAIPAA